MKGRYIVRDRYIVFGNRLNDALQNRGMKQKQLAACLGVDQTTVSRWVCGVTLPNVEHLKKIVDTLNVSVDYLFGREVGE